MVGSVCAGVLVLQGLLGKLFSSRLRVRGGAGRRTRSEKNRQTSAPRARGCWVWHFYAECGMMVGSVCAGVLVRWSRPYPIAARRICVCARGRWFHRQILDATCGVGFVCAGVLVDGARVVRRLAPCVCVCVCVGELGFSGCKWVSSAAQARLRLGKPQVRHSRN